MLNAVRLFRYSINLHETEPVLLLNFATTLCVDGNCEDLTIFDSLSIPIPTCDTNIALPGDGTIGGFVAALGGKVGAIGVGFIANMLGIGVSKQFNGFYQVMAQLF